jgi:hypothetical protein
MGPRPNLHMLHGIAYDILAYEGWTIRQKRSERPPAFSKL